MEFHLYLAKISDNTHLYHTMSSFMGIMNMYLLRTIRTAQPTLVPRQEHDEIIAAILEYNVARAKKAIRSHMRKALKKATETLAAAKTKSRT
jgi:DNA-binding GntR family transcriptional regulator